MASLEESKKNDSCEENDDFIYSYGWNRVMMKIIGGWPEDSDMILTKYQVYFNSLALLLFVCLPQTASITVFWGDLNAVIECIAVNFAINLSLLKLFWLGIQRSTIKRLLKLMAKDWMMEKSKEEHKEMLKMAKIIRLISRLSFYGTLCLFTAYVSLQILIGIQMRNDPNVDPRLSVGFLYTSVFPFNTSSPGVFAPIWICQFFMTYVSMASYSSPDSFLGMFIFHQCGQLKVLRRRLERIVDDDIIKNPWKFWNKLGEIVERHEHLNERASEIEENFNKIFLATILVCIFASCTQGFIILTIFEKTDGDFPFIQLIFVIIFIIYDLGHFFIYCFGGDILMNESAKFGVSLYNSEWYNLASNEAKSVLILMSRCKIPQQITGGKFTILSLPLFAKIIKTSASYLSVLLAMKV